MKANEIHLSEFLNKLKTGEFSVSDQFNQPQLNQEPETKKYDKLAKLKELNKDFNEYKPFNKSDPMYGKHFKK